MNHESKCATLHGHRYSVEVTAQAEKLDSIGRVIDFSVLKGKLGSWIDEHWDHTTIVSEEDSITVELLQKMPGFKHPYIAGFNPTAENMAEFLLRHTCPELFEGTGVQVVKVTIWETPNCKAEACL